MNFHWSNIFLTLIIFVKLKTLNAKNLENDIDEHPISRSHQRYFKLYPIQMKQYYKLFNRPFYKRDVFHSIKNKKNIDDMRPFVDLTRYDDSVETLHFGDGSKFSQDYIDISDLARYAKPPAEKKAAITQKGNKLKFIEIHGDTQQVLEILDKFARRYLPFQKRSNLDSDTESSSSDTKESTEKTKTITKNKTQLRYIPKRFQVINNNEEISDDDKVVVIDTSSDFDDDGRSKANSETSSDESNTDGVIDELLYIQSPTRHLKSSDMDWRRRLPHFLPKRMHWSERDLQDLRNYWINGPRGKFPALYKTPY